jgi:hypothetical protein
MWLYSWLVIFLLTLAAGARGQAPGLPPPPPPVAEYSPVNWKEFASAEGGFTVSMPGVPAISSEPVDTAVGRIVMHLYFLATKLGEYGVSYSDLPVKSDDAAVARSVLDGSRNEILGNGVKLLNEDDMTVEGILGRELIFEKGGVVVRERMFLVDGRLYALILAAAPNVAFNNGSPSSNPGDRTDLYETTSNRFFGSFRLIQRSAAASLPEQIQAANNGVLEPVAVKTDLYRTDANARNEIAEALKLASTGHKRVMLVFGGNWCYDCHVLDRALHEGAAGKVIMESFLLVHVDIGESDKNLDVVKKYKIPLEKGVPAVAILGGDGRLLYSSGGGEFEAARRMMKKDLVAFLNHWKKSEQ